MELIKIHSYIITIYKFVTVSGKLEYCIKKFFRVNCNYMLIIGLPKIKLLYQLKIIEQLNNNLVKVYNKHNSLLRSKGGRRSHFPLSMHKNSPIALSRGANYLISYEIIV